MVSRDRASSYADAAWQGAPQARQVADRFHLVKNVGERLKELLERKRTCFPYKEEKTPASLPPPLLQQETSQERNPTSQRGQKKTSSRHPVDTLLTANERQRLRNREKRYERDEAVKALRAQGLSHYEIAEALGGSRPTVRDFLNSEQFRRV